MTTTARHFPANPVYLDADDFIDRDPETGVWHTQRVMLRCCLCNTELGHDEHDREWFVPFVQDADTTHEHAWCETCADLDLEEQ